MSGRQKMFAGVLWVAAGLSTAVVVTAALLKHVADSAYSDTTPPQLTPAAAPGGLPVLYPAATFALTDQDGNPVTSDGLRGHVYIAAFIFTHCTSSCPMVSAHMATLLKSINDPTVKLVSFTVDPARDTPEVLKAYAAKLGATDGRWEFLTGTEAQLKAVEDAMHIGVTPPEANSDQPMHSTQLLLVDGNGQVRAIYGGATGDTSQLARDAVTLAAASPHRPL